MRASLNRTKTLRALIHLASTATDAAWFSEAVRAILNCTNMDLYGLISAKGRLPGQTVAAY